jgi:predicted nucleic acid-binding protein
LDGRYIRKIFGLGRGGERAVWPLQGTAEKRGARLDDFDLAIAAHALAFDANLVSANRKHMARIPGLKLESWL